MNDPHLAHFFLWRSQNTDLLRGWNSAYTLGVEAGLNDFHEFEILEIVDIYFLFKNYDYPIQIKFIRINSYLSFLSLTPQTLLLKLSSPMHFMSESSQSMTLVGGYLGVSPPPTRAIMLVRYSISTIPIPPSNSIVTRELYQRIKRTSVKSILERVSVINSEASWSAESEATLILIEAYEEYLFFLRVSRAHLLGWIGSRHV